VREERINSVEQDEWVALAAAFRKRLVALADTVDSPEHLRECMTLVAGAMEFEQMALTFDATVDAITIMPWHGNVSFSR
jgi:hypothetical protein